jgi:short subunit dehydrogenase-like uncharacterized protein
MNPVTNPFLLYGSYGYTGRLIADLAASYGMRPILSGRDPIRLKAQAERLGLKFHPISLEDRSSLEAVLKEVPLVLNCAGPFLHTYRPMLEACLKLGKHYLDITGEIMVFEALARYAAQAEQAGVMLLPGIGFDVVPSDCLGMHLKQRLPDATQLTIAIKGSGGGFSRGTALTGIEGFSDRGVVRKDGKLVPVALFAKTRQIDFGTGIRMAMSFPWGDVSTAYYSTGIPNIETYMVFPESGLRMRKGIRPLIGLASKPPIQWLLKKIVHSMPEGPSAEALKKGRSRLWGEVTNQQGECAVGRMITPDGYALTAETALAAVRHALAGDTKPGFQTASLAYGADFVLEFEGVQREDIQ